MNETYAAPVNQEQSRRVTVVKQIVAIFAVIGIYLGGLAVLLAMSFLFWLKVIGEQPSSIGGSVFSVSNEIVTYTLFTAPVIFIFLAIFLDKVLEKHIFSRLQGWITNTKVPYIVDERSREVLAPPVVYESDFEFPGSTEPTR